MRVPDDLRIPREHFAPGPLRAVVTISRERKREREKTYVLIRDERSCGTRRSH